MLLNRKDEMLQVQSPVAIVPVTMIAAEETKAIPPTPVAPRAWSEIRWQSRTKLADGATPYCVELAESCGLACEIYRIDVRGIFSYRMNQECNVISHDPGVLS